VLLFLALSAEEFLHLLRLAGLRVVDAAVAPDLTGEDTHEADLADVVVGHDLEDLGGQGRVGRLLDRLFAFLSLVDRSIDRTFGRCDRAGEEIHQFLDAHALVGARVEHGNHGAGRDRLRHDTGEFVRGDLFAAEVALEDVVVGLDHGFHDRFVDFLGLVRHVTRDVVRQREGRNDGRKGRAVTVGQVRRDQAFPEGLPEFAEQYVRLEVLVIHLVDHDDAAQAHLLGPEPAATGVDADAPGGVDHDDGGFDRREGLDRLAEELGASRSVEEVDPLAVPVHVQDRGVDGVPLVMLVGVEVGNRVLLRHAALTGDEPGLEEHGLGEAGLARVGVPAQGDVADVLRGVRHGIDGASVPWGSTVDSEEPSLGSYGASHCPRRKKTGCGATRKGRANPAFYRLNISGGRGGAKEWAKC